MSAACWRPSPFLLPSDLTSGLDRLIAGQKDYAFSVAEFPYPIQRALRIANNGEVAMFSPEHMTTRSQDLENAYHDAGQFYWGRHEAWIAQKTSLFKCIAGHQAAAHSRPGYRHTRRLGDFRTALSRPPRCVRRCRMTRTISIDGRAIGDGEAPFIVAEMSANHNGSIDNAFKIIDMAQKAGADAVKMQTYRPDTITLPSNDDAFTIKDGLWAGRTLYDLYDWAHTPWEWHADLFAYSRKTGITLFSSPFDATAVDLLEDLNAPAYKIASFEAVDLPLIRYVASTGKPMIVSTGMADAEEIAEAVAAAARDGGCRELAILHCISGYPAPPEDYNLRTIPDMIDRFGLVTGVVGSHAGQHDGHRQHRGSGLRSSKKHVTLDRTGGGPDDSFSLEATELANLCRQSRTAWSALGAVDYGRKSSEVGNVKFRRSLYFVADLEGRRHNHRGACAQCAARLRPGAPSISIGSSAGVAQVLYQCQQSSNLGPSGAVVAHANDSFEKDQHLRRGSTAANPTDPEPAFRQTGDVYRSRNQRRGTPVLVGACERRPEADRLRRAERRPGGRLRQHQ